MASLVAGTVRAVTSTSQIISGAYELSRSLVDLLKPASSRLDPNEAHYIFCIQRQIDCLLGPLELCMSWCRYRQPIAQRTINVVEETLRRVIDCIQKIDVVSGPKQQGMHASETFKRSYSPTKGLTGSAKGTNSTATIQILRRCLDELDIAVAQLTLTLTSLQLSKQTVSSNSQNINEIGSSSDVNKCVVHEQQEETISISTLLKAVRRLWEIENKYGDVCLQPGRLLLRLCAMKENACNSVKWKVILPRCFLRILKTTDNQTVIIFEKSEFCYPTKKSSFSSYDKKMYYRSRDRDTDPLPFETNDCEYLLVDENGSVECSRHSEEENEKKKNFSSFSSIKNMACSNDCSNLCRYNNNNPCYSNQSSCNCFDLTMCERFPQCPEQLRFSIKIAEFMRLCFGESTGYRSGFVSDEEKECKNETFQKNRLKKDQPSSDVENRTENCIMLDEKKQVDSFMSSRKRQTVKEKQNDDMSRQLDSIIDEAFITKPFLVWPLLLEQKLNEHQTKSECSFIDLRSFINLLKRNFSEDKATFNFICSVLKSHFVSHNCKAFPVGPLFAFDFYDSYTHHQLMLNNKLMSFPHDIVFGQYKGLSPLEFLYTARLCTIPESMSNRDVDEGRETANSVLETKIMADNEFSSYTDKTLTTQLLWSAENRPPSFSKKLIHSVFEPHPANVRMSDDLIQNLLCNCFIENVTKR